MLSVARMPGWAIFLVLLVLAFSVQACDGPGTVMVSKPPLPAPTPMSDTLTQTLEGVTAKVNVVNADAHRVVFDLTIEGPAQPYGYALEITWIYEPQLSGPVLRAGEKELPFLPNAGMFSGAQTAGALPLSSRGMIAFDASDLQWNQPRLPLHLSLPLLVNNQPFVAPLPVPTGTQPPTSTPTQVPPASHVITFDFTFDAAYDARQVVLEPHQEVESDEVKMTLERIDVTASEALMTISYSSTTPDNLIYQGDWVSYSELKVGPLVGPEGQETIFTLVGEPDGCYGSAGDNRCIFSFVDRALSLIDRAPVDCTLTVTAGRNEQRHIQVGNYSSSSSSGVFHFTLPISTTK